MLKNSIDSKEENSKTYSTTRKSLFAHKPKRFVMEDRPFLGGRKPRGEVLG